jgi:serine/threonine protein kinase
MQEQTKVGQYVLERKLGEGGMAEVWEARHIHLGSRAAIKFLLPRLASNRELEDRFLHEGVNPSFRAKRQTGARPKHPIFGSRWTAAISGLQLYIDCGQYWSTRLKETMGL